MNNKDLAGNSGLFQDLRNSIESFNQEKAGSIVKKMLEEKIDPLKIFSEMTETLKNIGDGFSKGMYFLPDLIGAGDVMTHVLPVIEEEIKKGGLKVHSLGNIVIGTVVGDIHSIGKTMVATLLKYAGFNVYDVGIDVSAKDFIDAVKKYNADILAMSALLTTTANEMIKVIENMGKEGIRGKVKIMVGGGAITEEFAKSIGADGYDPTAPGAVTLAKKMLNL